MRKLILQAPPENGAITNYTSEVSRLLRPAVPGEQADEIVGEAEAHLYDQAETIKMRENVSQNEAEARAVAAFTPAVAFAREMAQSAVETRYSRVWFAVSKVTAFLAVGCLAAGFVVDGSVTLPLSVTSSVGSAASFSHVVFMVLSILLCLCAFLARRAQTARLVFVITLASAFVFGYAGFLYAIPLQTGAGRENPVSRLSAQNYVEGLRHVRLPMNYEEVKLSAGLQMYRAEHPVVYGGFKTPNGTAYLVPTIIAPKTNRIHNASPNRAKYISLKVSWTESVKTLTEARSRWLTEVPAIVTQLQNEQEYIGRYEQQSSMVAQRRDFDDGAGRRCAMKLIASGLFLMLFEAVYAKIGRAVYNKRRALRERKWTQAR